MGKKRKATERERAAGRRDAGERWFEWHRQQCPAVLLLPDAQPDGLLSRADAIAQGVRWYRTGAVLPCGHASWQYVSNDRCRECAVIEVRG